MGGSNEENQNILQTKVFDWVGFHHRRVAQPQASTVRVNAYADSLNIEKLEDLTKRIYDRLVDKISKGWLEGFRAPGGLEEVLSPYPSA